MELGTKLDERTVEKALSLGFHAASYITNDGLKELYDFDMLIASRNNIRFLNTSTGKDFYLSNDGDVVMNADLVIKNGNIRGHDRMSIGSPGETTVIKGSLRVEGTMTSVYSENLEISDHLIEIAKGAQTKIDADGAGFILQGADATLTYSSNLDRFEMNYGINISGDILIQGNHTTEGDADVYGSTTTKTLTVSQEADIYGDTLRVRDGSVSVSENLDIASDVSIGNNLLVENDTTLNGLLDVSGDTHLYSQLGVGTPPTSTYQVDVAGDIHTQSVLRTNKKLISDSRNLVFTGAQSSTGVILRDDTLGINTTPQNTLDVNGTLNVDDASVLNDKLDVSGTTHLFDTVVAEKGIDTSTWRAKDGYPFITFTDGSVGICESSPAYDVDISGVVRASERLQSSNIQGDTGTVAIGTRSSTDTLLVGSSGIAVGTTYSANTIRFQYDTRFLSDISVDGSASVDGPLLATDNIISQSALESDTIYSRTGPLTVDAPSDITLITDTSLTIDASSTRVKGDIEVDTSLTVPEATITTIQSTNTSVDASLTVHGKTYLRDNVSITKKLSVSEDTSINSSLTVDDGVIVNTITPRTGTDVSIGSTFTVDNTQIISDVSLGIGVENPSTKLDVAGDASFSSRVIAPEISVASIYGRPDLSLNDQVSLYDGSDAVIHVPLLTKDGVRTDTIKSRTSDLSLSVLSAAKPSLTIANDTGYVGFRTSEPSHTVDISGSIRTTDTLYSDTLEPDTSTSIQLQSYVFITSDKVGIHISEPSYDLDVSGDAHVSGVLHTGNITSDDTSLTLSSTLIQKKDATFEGSLSISDDVHAYSDTFIDGQLGVGTTTPAYSIDTPGSIRADTSFIGSSLTTLGTTLTLSAENVIVSKDLNANGDISTSKSLYVNDQIGVGTNSPSYDVDVANTIRGQSSLRTPLIESDGGDLTLVSSSDMILDTATTSNLIYLDDISGYVGINTGNPSYVLDVSGDISTNSSLYVEKNIGIRTEKPEYPLDVHGDISTNKSLYVREKIGIGKTDPSYTIDAIDTIRTQTSIRTSLIESDGSNMSITTTNSGSDMILDTATSSNLIYLYDPSGYVGINTESPSYVLDVSGDISTNSSLFVANNIGIRTETPDHPLDVHGDISTNKSLYVKEQIGVGMTDPSYGIDAMDTIRARTSVRTPLIESNGGDLTLTSSSDMILDTATSSNLIYLDDTSGYIGINTGSPSYVLDVSGDISTNASLFVANNVGIRTNIPEHPLDVHGDISTNKSLYVREKIGIGNTDPSYTIDAKNTIRAQGKLRSSTLESDDSDLTLTTTNNGNLTVRTDTYNNRIFINDNDGMIGVGGETNPSYQLDISGDVQVQGILRSTKLKSNTDNLTLEPQSKSNTLIVDNTDGSVAINTTDPKYQLDVNGDIQAHGTLRSTKLKSDTSNLTLEPQNASNALIVDNTDGSVAISTTDPKYQLEVNGDISTNKSLYVKDQIGIGTTTPSYDIDAKDTIRAQGKFRSSTLESDDSDLTLTTTNNGNLTVRTDRYNDRIFINDNNGRIGIGGETEPSYQFDVSGDVQAQGILRSTKLKSNTDNLTLEPENASNALIVDNTDGSIAINTTEPKYQLDVNGDIQAHGTLRSTKLKSDTSNLTLEPQDVSNVLIVDNTDGSVGINTTDPKYQLEVNGDISTNKSLYVKDQIGIGTTTPSYDVDAKDIIRAQGKLLSSTLESDDGNLTLTTTSNGNLTVQTDRYNDRIFINDNNGRIGIGGETEPSYQFDVSGDVQAQGIFRSTKLKSNIGNLILEPESISNALIVDNTDGSVAINTTYPKYQLDVNGDIQAHGTFRSTKLKSDTSNLTLEPQDVSNALIVDNTDGSVAINSTDPKYQLDVNGDISTNSSLYVATNIGIGTTLPDYPLDVHGDISTNKSLYVKKKIGIGMTDPSYNIDAMDTIRARSSVRTPLIESDGEDLTLISSSNMIFDTATTSNLVYLDDTSGYIGIKTGSPSYVLDVSGDISTNASLFVANNVGIRTNIPDHPLDVHGDISTNKSLYVKDEIGIGTTTPSYDVDAANTIRAQGKLRSSTLESDDSDLTLTTTNNGNLTVRTDTYNNRIFINDNDGMIGVGGETNPSYQFDVSGDVQAQGILRSTKLKSNTDNLTLEPESISNALIVDNTDGSIAINTTEPKYQLDVNGDIQAHGTLRSTKLKSDTSNLTLEPQDVLNSLIVDNTDGSIAINTTDPKYQLEVNGDISTNKSLYVKDQIGIGTTTPSYDIDAKNTIRAQGKFRSYTLESDDSDLTLTTTNNGNLTIRTDRYNDRIFINDNNGRIGIGGETDPSYQLDISGDVQAQGILKSTKLKSNTDNLTLEPENASNALIVDNTDGSIAINTTDPKYQLDVNGDIQAHGIFRSTKLKSDISNLTLEPQDVSNALIVDNTDGSVAINTTNPKYQLDVNGNVYTNSSLYVATNIGIGTSSPDYPLDVHGDISTNKSLYVNKQIGVGTKKPSYDIDVMNTIKASSSVRTPLIESNGGNLTLTSSSDMILNTATTSDLIYLDDTSGYIGINTGSPSHILDISGDISTNSSLFVANNIGIRTEAPDHPLDVHGDISTNKSLYVKDEIGIGTTNPSYKLDVAGDIYASGKVKTTTLSSDSDITISSTELILHGDVSMSKTLDVSQNFHAFSDAQIDGNATIGSMNVGDITTSDMTIDGTIDVSDYHHDFSDAKIDKTLTVDGDTVLNKALDVSNSTTLHDTLSVLNSATFESDMTIKGKSDISGATTIYDTLHTYKDAQFDKNITVDTSATINDTLHVQNAATLNSTLDIGGKTTMSNNASIGSNLSVSGKTTVQDISINGKLKAESDPFVIDPKPYDSSEGTVLLKSDVYIEGTLNTVNRKTLNVSDSLITVADGADTKTEADTAGLFIDGADIEFRYDVANERMNLKNSANGNIGLGINKDADAAYNLDVKGPMRISENVSTNPSTFQIGDDAIYFGQKNETGSWRVRRSSDNSSLRFEKYNGSSYVLKVEF